MSDWLRELLFPLLVILIVASLWIVGRSQEMEDDIRHGVPPDPRFAVHAEMANAE